MKLALSVSAFLALTASHVFAFDASDIERCKAIEPDAPRLACFDAVTADVTQTAPQGSTEEPATSPARDTGSWAVVTNVDPITDEKVLTAAIESQAGTSYRRPTMILRCKSGSPEVYISWQTYLSDEDYVTIRIDDEEPKSSSWSQSTDQTATFAYQPEAFIDSIRRATQVSARITPFRSGPITATFPVDGLEAILAEHVESCGVK